MTKAEFRRRFAKVVSDRMWDLGINQSELARKIGVSQMAVCSLVNRKSVASTYVISKLAYALECSVSDLTEFADDT